MISLVSGIRSLLAIAASPSPLAVRLRHGVQVHVEGLRIAEIKDTRLGSTGERMRHTAGKADVGQPAQRGAGAIRRDISEVSLEPDIELVAGVTVVRKCIVRRQSYHGFEPLGFATSAQHGDLGARRDTFGLQWLPDQLVQVDNGLVRPKGKGLLVGPSFVLGYGDVGER